MLKRSLICLAVLSTLSGVASAQSVTIFGIMDVGVRYVRQGNNDITRVDTSGASTSRFGFRGLEDLGGGMKAGFWLESGVNLDDGSAGATVDGSARFWNRRTTVSLIGNFGEIRLGRDFSPAYRVATGSDPFGDTGLGGISRVYSTGSINGAAYFTHTRMDNSVTYFLPGSLGGVYGQASVAAGEGRSGNRLYGGLIGYKAGPLDVSAGYSQTRVISALDEDVKNAAFAASYDFGVVKLAGTLSQLKYTTAKEDHATINAVVPFGPGSLIGSYVHSVGKGGTYTADNRKNIADLVAVGYRYDLSKRTTLYTNAVHIKNKGGYVYTVGGLTAPAVAPVPATGNSVRKSQGFDVGIRHAF